MKHRSWMRFNIIGILILIVYVFIAVFPHLFTVHDPLEQNIANRLASPSSENIFGTDELGRDILSRCIYGTKSSLIVAVIAVIISTTLGVLFGLVSGYSRGLLDSFLSRTFDILVSFPAIIIALTMITIVGQNVLAVAFVIGIVNIPSFFRVTRAITMKVNNLAYVDAVRTFGSSKAYLLFRTILPNCYSEILVQILMVGSRAIIVEASLSFLGLGMPPPAPSWGGMLSLGRNYMYQNVWYSIVPGLFIVLLVLSIQFTANYIKERNKK